MSLRIAHWMLIMLLIGASPWLVAQEKPAKQDKPKPEASKPEASKVDRDPSFWMKQKLTNSERILEGLTKGDLDLVAKNATAMRALNRIEQFVRREPGAYRTQLNSFQFSVEELVRTAEENNLDGAALAFTQMTLSCVQCHKHIRKN